MYVDAVIENPANVALSQNYPNPFSAETTIEFTLNEADHVQVVIYNLTGAIVSVLAEGQYASGTHSVKWNASGIPAGYYFYSIKTGNSNVVKKASKIR